MVPQERGGGVSRYPITTYAAARGGRHIIDQHKIEALIATWSGLPGGAERKNFAAFLYDLIDALDLPCPGPGQAGVLGDYEFEGSVAGGSAKLTGAGGSADLYRRGCFVMEAKQSYLRPGETAPDLYGDGATVPISPAGATYDRLMVRAQAQAKNYVVNLPGDHPSVPFLIVCDVGRAFELLFNFNGNGRTYEYYPDKQRYRIPIARLREPGVQALFRNLWLDPLALDPKRQTVAITRDVSAKLAEITRRIEDTSEFKRELAVDPETATEEVALFLMRLLFCMFAEDIELLPKGRFVGFLRSCVPERIHSASEPMNQQKLELGLSDLWSKMGQGGLGERYAWALESNVRYFNGGLFEGRRIYPLGVNDVYLLIDAAERDWRNVEPAIFGTLLEQALTVSERAKLGAHYTPRAYVERLVDATMMDVLNAEWEAVEAGILRSSPARGGGPPAEPVVEGAPSQTKDAEGDARALGPLHPSPAASGPPPRAGEDLEIVTAFHHRIASIRVLDPACGTGNFLYVAMEALERLEARVVETLQQLGGRAEPKVGPHQFLGLELNPRAAKIAELVLWIGWLRFRIENNPESVPEPVLARSDNINFGRHGGYDAVLRQLDSGAPDLAQPMPPEWPDADFIIGNPPFIGGKDLRERLGGDYAEALWRANPRVPKSADFVMQWWDRAAHILTRPGSRLKRFGFVTTNSITQEFSRRVIAGYLEKSSPERGGGPPAEPVVEGAPSETADAVGDARALGPLHPSPAASGPPPRSGEDFLSLVFAIPDHPWTRAGKDSAAVRIAMTVAQRGRHHGVFAEVVREAKLDSDAPEVALSNVTAPIRSNLAVGADVTSVTSLVSNKGVCSNGMKPLGAGFIVAKDQIDQLGFQRREGWENIVRPYVNGRDLAGKPRGIFALDFFGLSEQLARIKFPEIYQHILTTVRPERLAALERSNTADNRDYAEKWWMFCKPRQEMRSFLVELDRFIVTVQTAKHRTFQFLPSDVMPDQKLMVFGLSDGYSLGVRASRLHSEWAVKTGGWLGVGNDSVYSKSKTFDPFPFPDATPAQRAAIAELAEELDSTRKLALAEVPKLTMTELYNLRDRLRAGGMDRATEARAVAARAGIVDRLHDQIDRAVADAYGWPHDLPPLEIVARLVALNAERAAEERAGHVRWLRPEYQAARFGKGGGG